MIALLDTYIGLVTAGGAISMAIAIIFFPFASIDPLMFAVLLTLAAVAQRIPVFLFRSSAISVSFAAVIASYVLYGPAPAVILGLAQACVNSVTPRRKPARKQADYLPWIIGAVLACLAVVAVVVWKVSQPGEMAKPTVASSTGSTSSAESCVSVGRCTSRCSIGVRPSVERWAVSAPGASRPAFR